MFVTGVQTCALPIWMFCPDLDREQAFGDVLSGATHYEVDGDMLMLLTDGELRAVLQAR